MILLFKLKIRVIKNEDTICYSEIERNMYMGYMDQDAQNQQGRVEKGNRLHWLYAIIVIAVLVVVLIIIQFS